MARRKVVDDEVEELEEISDEVTDEVEEDSPKRTSRGPQPPRISITIPSSMRRALRIAAAKADMEVSEWCKVVLVTAAKKTVERLYPEEAGEE